MSKKQYLGFIALLVIVLAFSFYWYEWRPTKIKRQCYAEAEFDWGAITAKTETEKQQFKDNYYTNCLMRFGLK